MTAPGAGPPSPRAFGIPELPEDGPRAAQPFSTFEYLRFAKREMGGARFPLCLSGVPTVQPFAEAELARLGASHDLPPALAAWREAIAARYRVPAAHAWPAYGASGAVHLALSALVAHEPERRPVAVEAPAYGVFETVAELLGCEVRRVPRSEDSGWSLDLDAVDTAFSRGAGVFCVTDLHNPTGARLSAAEVAALDEIASRHRAWVVVDEVYRDFLDGPVATAYRPGGRLVVTSSFTKCYGAGPLRAGWVLAEPEVIERVESVEEAVCGVPPGPWLATLAAVVPHAGALLERGRALAAAARPVVDAWIASTPDVSWTPPVAGITGLVRVEGLRDSLRFARALRSELGVQVVPGAFFGAEGTIRISFGLPPRELQAALDVLALGIPPLRV